MSNSKQLLPAFSALNLSLNTLRGIRSLGYQRPTPIQKAAIPHILNGLDVVAEARTGSGKTAAFLIPLLDRLEEHRPIGPRAILLAPTRELVIQTMQHLNKITRHTQLRTAVLLGGESMEEQFQAMHSQPDIVLATPVRLQHLAIEMSLKLDNVEMVIMDEADRLFELGYGKQLEDVFSRLPNNRQTLIFSATLPELLVNFTQSLEGIGSTGLSRVRHIQLDRDKRLSELLQIHYLYVPSSESRDGLLVYLLRNCVHRKEQTLVFLPTKLQVEFCAHLLRQLNIPCTEIHSQLDPEARANHMLSFRRRQVPILLASDTAARGVDLPILDVVINWNYPDSVKLFVHRAGRVARAGRSGCVINLIDGTELTAALFFHSELARPLQRCSNESIYPHSDLIGRVPQILLDEYNGLVKRTIQESVDLTNLIKPCKNALKKRQSIAKSISNKYPGSVVGEGKELLEELRSFRTPLHTTLIGNEYQNNATDRHDEFLAQLRTLQSKPSIFQFNNQSSQSEKDLIAQERVMKERKRKTMIMERHESNRSIKRTASLGSDLFGLQMDASSMDLVSDVLDGSSKITSGGKTWDWKTKKFKGVEESEKMMRTDTGVLVKASFKSDLYKKWLEKKKSTCVMNEWTEKSRVMGLKKRPNYRQLNTLFTSTQKNMKKCVRKSGQLKGREVMLKEMRVEERRENALMACKKRKMK